MSLRVMSCQRPAVHHLTQVVHLDRSVADDLQQRLVVPDVILARGDVQVAHQDRLFRLVAVEMVAHVGQEVELLAKLEVLLTIWYVTPPAGT
jgi:hypothetical protein